MADEKEWSLSLREVCNLYGLADSTLREWIDNELFGVGVGLPTERRRGRKTVVLHQEHIARLERFLRYRGWFSMLPDQPTGPMETAIGLVWRVDQEEYEGVIEVLSGVEQILEDALGEVRAEIQSLHARVYGDEEINPEEIDALE